VEREGRAGLRGKRERERETRSKHGASHAWLRTAARLPHLHGGCRQGVHAEAVQDLRGERKSGGERGA